MWGEVIASRASNGGAMFADVELAGFSGTKAAQAATQARVLVTEPSTRRKERKRLHGRTIG